MAEPSARKRIWGWYFFDWASQPYNTLLLTFIFGPYFAAIVSDYFIAQGIEAELAKARTQTIWSWTLTGIGLAIAVLAPILGAFADTTGRRMPWIWLFSALYVVGSYALWWTYPDASNFRWMLLAFAIGFVGMEFAIIFTNSLMPDLGPAEDMGRLSGSGFAFGYWGGVLSLVMMLLLFAENETGKTLIGIEPLFGLDAQTREGTRFVGPFTAIWYAVFMVFFFLWVREPVRKVRRSASGMAAALATLAQTLKSLPHRISLASFLGSSLLYRDALNGLYGFGGVYATLVLDWSIIQVGVFGIAGAISAAAFTWVGGLADQRWGPKPVLAVCILALAGICTIIVGMSREQIFGVPLAQGSALPDYAFYACGVVIGACGGSLQAASRTMMVRHADPGHTTEAFGLYALSGKATAFLAPALIGTATIVTGSPRLGVMPLILLFLLGLWLLRWVEPDPKPQPA